MTHLSILSHEFSRIINEWLTTEEIIEINKRNATPEYANSCATHEFCDPNEAMLMAFSKVYGKEFTLTKGNMKLWNSAWDLSKANGFNVMHFYKITIRQGRKIQGIYYRQFDCEKDASEWATDTTTKIAECFGKASFSLTEISLDEYMLEAQV